MPNQGIWNTKTKSFYVYRTRTAERRCGMKCESDINGALSKVNTNESNFQGMTYEQGVEEALMWVLGEINDTEFEFAK
jgi:hypothetical protein